jgi:plastocyanin
MMASAYDLDVALSTCDSFGDQMASDGCWQGVFMENVNAVMRGEAREGVFSDADPLAPCSRVAERHKWECYINHAGRLITLLELSVGDASQACLAASSGFVAACIQSLGLMVSNPAWQLTLVGPESRGRNLEVTVELCGRFPADYRLDCVIGAVDNILNFDGVVLDRALRYCEVVGDPHREQCYVRIGVAIQSQVTDLASRSQLCQAVEEPYRTRCLEGAGVATTEGRPSVSGRPSPESVAPRPATSAVGANERGRKPSPAVVVAEPSVEVLVDEGGFAPETVVIQAGDTVRWRNVGDDLMWPASDDHPTHELYGGFDAQRPIGPGDTWSFTFDRRGKWGYHNHMTPRLTGTVIVE